MTENPFNPRYGKEMVTCPWCGEATRPVFKHGHSECGRCSKPLSDCCDGEQHQTDEVDTV